MVAGYSVHLSGGAKSELRRRAYVDKNTRLSKISPSFLLAAVLPPLPDVQQEDFLRQADVSPDSEHDYRWQMLVHLIGAAISTTSFLGFSRLGRLAAQRGAFFSQQACALSYISWCVVRFLFCARWPEDLTSIGISADFVVLGAAYQQFWDMALGIFSAATADVRHRDPQPLSLNLSSSSYSVPPSAPQSSNNHSSSSYSLPPSNPPSSNNLSSSSYSLPPSDPSSAHTSEGDRQD